MIAIGHPWRADGQRRVFRLLLEAWAYPGTIVELAPWCGDSDAALAVLACLADAAAALCDAHGLLADADRSRLGAAPAPVHAAQFVLADAARPPDGLAPDCGSLLAPERGATLVLRCRELGAGATLALRGPGIAGTATLAVSGVHPAWWAARAAWCRFPLGVDLVLCAGTRLACLPRTTEVRESG